MIFMRFRGPQALNDTYEISRKCCKQRAYRIAKPFRFRTYKKQGGGGVTVNQNPQEGFLSPLPRICRRGSSATEGPLSIPDKGISPHGSPVTSLVSHK